MGEAAEGIGERAKPPESEKRTARAGTVRAEKQTGLASGCISRREFRAGYFLCAEWARDVCVISIQSIGLFAPYEKRIACGAFRFGKDDQGLPAIKWTKT